MGDRGAERAAADAGGLAEAFAAEARRGAELALFARLAIFALLWASFWDDAHGNFGNPVLIYRSALVAAGVAGGLLHFVLGRRAARPVAWSYLFLAVDLAIVGALVFGWLPPDIADYPQFLAVRLGDVMILAALLSSVVLPLSGRLAGFAGLAAMLVWAGGVLSAFQRTPGAVTDLAAGRGARGFDDLLARISAPEVLNVRYLALQLVLIALFAGLLRAVIGEGRAMVERAVRAGREGDFLGRFFPPRLLARLEAEGGGGRGPAAILFADRKSDGGPEALEAWFQAAEAAVRDCGGVIDPFVGDPVMASFGVLERADPAAAAAAALACARRLAHAGARVGLDLGEVVWGEVGSERQPAFGVVGDAVNAARRLLDEAEARGAPIVLSAAAADAAGAAAGLAPLEPGRGLWSAAP